MNKYIIVGAGGTGSYLVNNILNYLRSGNGEKISVILIDGDILEDRNLLRQGFLKKDIGKNKAEVLADRFRKTCPNSISIEAKPIFIERIADITDLVKKDDKVTLISCVDNNMARYRIIMSQYKLFDMYGETVKFIDAGNDEWHGQTLVNQLNKEYKSPITFKNNKVEYTGKIEGHNLTTIFDNNEDWKSMLTRGDHELSCDVITEASPQNIAANMTSAMGIMQMLYKTTLPNFNSQRLQFNASSGTIELLNVESRGVRLESFVEYANGEGNIELFKEKVKVEVQQKQETEEPIKSLELELEELGIEKEDELFTEEMYEEDNEENSIEINRPNSFKDLDIEWEDEEIQTEEEDYSDVDLSELFEDDYSDLNFSEMFEDVEEQPEELHQEEEEEQTINTNEMTISQISAFIGDTRNTNQLQQVLEDIGIDSTTIQIDQVNRRD